jgi:hypothetical protein
MKQNPSVIAALRAREKIAADKKDLDDSCGLVSACSSTVRGSDGVAYLTVEWGGNQVQKLVARTLAFCPAAIAR